MGRIIKTFENFSDPKMDKGKEIIYTFTKQAITSENGDKEFKHNVYLIKGKALKDDKFGGIILSVEDTPGSWYLDTIFNYSSSLNYDTMSINGDWVCVNWKEIMTELKSWVFENINL